ncbi:MAG: TonB-dependent receptor, partial [Acidobacteria bacterium]|nr:TonB-dependent receptor [Acidobacteriota bacterium]
FRSDAFPRPTGRIPVVDDPRVPGETVGGALYPEDRSSAFADAFANRGTSQPKFDVRVDQDLADGRISYSGGVAGTEGLVHTGVGPFDVQRGSYLGYAKVGYERGNLRAQVFTNLLNGGAPNLLLPDPDTGQPVHLGFGSQTVDAEIGHSTFVGQRNYLTYGGNVRRNTFDITIGPDAADRLELGAYLQDEIFFDRFRLVLGGRVDKFGNLAKPVFSPRVSFMMKPGVDHSVTLSYNRAFRSPSMINNFLDMQVVQPVDLSGLAVFRPFLPLLLPPSLPPAAAQGAVRQLEQQLDQTTAQPFPLVVRVAGSDVPVGDMARIGLTEESLTAYELSYTGTFGQRTTAGAAVYLNRRDNLISLVPLPTDIDPYTARNPPPGWLLPSQALSFMALVGVFLPQTAYTYVNLGPTQTIGAELWVDHRFSRSLSTWFNYSWQDDPEILKSDNPNLPTELSLPPTHRVNVGASLDGSRFLGNLSVSAATAALWSDVLTPDYHGYSDGYAMVNGTFGLKWSGGAITTLVKVTNLFNQSIQQHVFGDILRRTVVGEVRFSM